MKISYQDKPIVKNPILADLNSGDVFTPIGSQCIYICCDRDASDRFITNDCTETWGAVKLIGTELFEDMDGFEARFDYDELLVCVSLVDGEIVLLYKGLEVKPLNCELVVNKD